MTQNHSLWNIINCTFPKLMDLIFWVDRIILIFPTLISRDYFLLFEISKICHSLLFLCRTVVIIPHCVRHWRDTLSLTHATVFQDFPHSLAQDGQCPQMYPCLLRALYITGLLCISFFKEFLPQRISWNSPTHILSFFCLFYQLKSHPCDRQALNMAINAPPPLPPICGLV